MQVEVIDGPAFALGKISVPPGGGGYGKPGNRTAETIAADIELGYVSAAAAKRDYPRAAKAKAKPARRARAARTARRTT